MGTTLVDRRIVSLLVDGIPPDLLEEAIKRHRKHAALLHRAEEMLLRADLTLVDFEHLAQVLSVRVRQFAPGVLESVHALGGQFANAKIITIPGGESLDSQRRMIKFWSSWHWELGKGESLTIAPSIGSEVIYLSDVVGGSLRCTFDKVEGRDCVRDILDRLPNVPGVRWIVGNTPTYCRVLADHLRNEDQHLLPSVYTWTTDTRNKSSYGGPYRLVVGGYGSGGVVIRIYPPGGGYGVVGLFVLGVPQDS